eukprot:2046111-Alexandrium_andersonii.AAC.1
MRVPVPPLEQCHGLPEGFVHPSDCQLGGGEPSRAERPEGLGKPCHALQQATVPHGRPPRCRDAPSARCVGGP